MRLSQKKSDQARAWLAKAAQSSVKAIMAGDSRQANTAHWLSARSFAIFTRSRSDLPELKRANVPTLAGSQLHTEPLVRLESPSLSICLRCGCGLGGLHPQPDSIAILDSRTLLGLPKPFVTET